MRKQFIQILYVQKQRVCNQSQERSVKLSIKLKVTFPFVYNRSRKHLPNYFFKIRSKIGRQIFWLYQHLEYDTNYIAFELLEEGLYRFIQ